MTTLQYLRADRIAIATGAGALALILGALGFQYLGGLAPCEMCYWQRWPHIAAAIIGILGGGFMPVRHGRTIAVTAIVLVAISGVIGAYQAGMQAHLFHGPSACTVDHPYILGSNEVPQVRCDIPIPVLFGLGLPIYNAMISLLIAGLASLCLWKSSRAA